MKNLRFPFIALLILCSSVLSHAGFGTFIQLNRGYAEKTVEEWEADIAQMKSAGINSLIIQWSAEPPVVFFDFPVKRTHYFDESYPVLEKIFEANREHNLDIHLGLQNNPYFWTQIKGRDRVLRDFFLLRISRNERLQVELLKRFNNEPSWKGYYIPDEIDDYTWRHDSKLPAIRRYVHHLSERLKLNDPDRTIAVSAFFRGRTSPNIVAETLLRITAGSDIDTLLLQDGVGVGDPPIEYLPIYYGAIKSLWEDVSESPENLKPYLPAENESETKKASKDESDEEISMQEEEPVVETIQIPVLWGIVETFKQTSGPNEDFSAVPGSVESVQLQMEEAETLFDTNIFFTFLDYMSPSLGKEAEALFDLLKEKNNSAKLQE